MGCSSQRSPRCPAALSAGTTLASPLCLPPCLPVLPDWSQLIIDGLPVPRGPAAFAQHAAAELFAESLEGFLISKGHLSPGARLRLRKR